MATPLVLLGLVVWAVHRWPRMYGVGFFAAGLLVVFPTGLFWLYGVFSEEPRSLGMAVAAALALTLCLLTFVFDSGADMQSDSRCRLHTPIHVSVLKPSLEVPLRERAPPRKPWRQWERQSVVAGLPAAAHGVRRRIFMKISVWNLVSMASWMLMLGFSRDLWSWALLGVFAGLPLIQIALARRVRFAGLRDTLNGASVAQVIDPFAPRLLEVDLSQGAVIRREPKVSWVALDCPLRGCGALLIAVDTRQAASLPVALVTSHDWALMKWFGLIRVWGESVGSDAYVDDASGVE